MAISRAAGAALTSCLVGAAIALEDPITELEAVVVTAPSGDGTARTVPHSVSIITAQDIARSTATSVADLLGREANLNLQSFFGAGRYNTIDIRGMGATASSNTLVLVDGVPLNEVDLSGADLSSVPLAQVERIEVLRGGGAVRYGNGAVGGVINIITRRARPGEVGGFALGGLGSYNTREFRANAKGGLDQIAGSFTYSTFDTDGFRQNGFVDARDVAAEVRLFPRALDFLDGYFRLANHRDDSGLPGPVSAEAFTSGRSARRASRFPNDRSSVDDTRYVAGANALVGQHGRLSLQASYRDRVNPYVIGYNPRVLLADQQSEIAAKTWDLRGRYEDSAEAFGTPVSFGFGVDLLYSEYRRSENGQYVLDSSTRRTGGLDSRGFYAEVRMRLKPQLTASGGLRVNRFSTQVRDERYSRAGCQTVFETIFVDILPGPGVILVPIQVPRLVGCVDAYRTQAETRETWRNTGAELGLTWQQTPALVWFSSVSWNFRNPNVDELLLAAADLRPQTGRTMEAGVRYAVGARAELALAAFYMRIDDEIYFGQDPRTGLGVNRNFDRATERIGGELEARWLPLQSLAVRANVGYVSARFAGVGAHVPLVPNWTASAELQWTIVPWARWLLAGRYVSSRFDGNDFDNTQYPKLPAYTQVDTAFRFAARGLQVTLGVKNLFNEVYSTVAYSNTFYPMPERSFYVQLQAAF